MARPAERPHPRRPHVVAAVIPPQVSVLELAVACEVFGRWDPPIADPWYELRICGEGPSEELGGAFSIRPSHGLDGLADADTVIAMPFDLDDLPDSVVAAVRAAYERGARLLAFCTGAFVLAAAGVLDGRKATTHWRSADELARQYPEVQVDPCVLYVDGGQVLTSAGAAASADLALYVIRCDYGAEVANTVARRMVLPPHRDGGQAQYVEMPVAETAATDHLGATLEWALDHLDEPISVSDLAARSLMSPRTFARRFRAVVGTTPHRWLLRQRVLRAQALLETTDEPVERIAHASGFGSAGALRLHFQELVRTSPLAYRRTFRRDGIAAVDAG